MTHPTPRPPDHAAKTEWPASVSEGLLALWEKVNNPKESSPEKIKADETSFFLIWKQSPCNIYRLQSLGRLALVLCNWQLSLMQLTSARINCVCVCVLLKLCVCIWRVLRLHYTIWIHMSWKFFSLLVVKYTIKKLKL